MWTRIPRRGTELQLLLTEKRFLKTNKGQLPKKFILRKLRSTFAALSESLTTRDHINFNKNSDELKNLDTYWVFALVGARVTAT